MAKRDFDIQRVQGVSAANTSQTVSTPAGAKIRISHIEVVYSAAPTHTGVIVKKKDASSSTYDAIIRTGSANDQHNSFEFNGDYILPVDEQIEVTAPAGGGVITSKVVIYYENVN